MKLDREVADTSAALISPPPRLNVADWADLFAWIPAEGNAEPGKYRTARCPHQIKMLNDSVDKTAREVIWMMASQAAGKTCCFCIQTEYDIHQMHRSMLMVRPTIATAKEWMSEKLLPMVEATPCMDGLLPEPRKRGSRSISTNRKFTGGSLKICGAKSPASFRGSSAPVVRQDECDAYPNTKEGDPCKLGDRAAITFSDAVRIKASTPTYRGASRIEEKYEQSDKQKYCLPCPCCGHFADLKWHQLKFSFTEEEYAIAQAPGFQPFEHEWQVADDLPIRDTKLAFYVCEKCNHGWTDSQRLASYFSGHPDNPPIVVNGKELRADWVRTAPFTGIIGRELNGMYLSMGLKAGYENYFHQFAEEFLAAKKGGRETLMVWTNTFLNQSWEEPSEKIEWKAIKNRAEDFTIDPLPLPCVWIFGGGDIQKDRLETLIFGCGVGQEVWILEHQIFWGDFDMPSVSARVEQYLTTKRFRHEILGDLKISCFGLDTGHQTKVKAAYKFCAKLFGSNVLAVNGSNKDLSGLIYTRGKERIYGAPRFNLNTDLLKSTIFERIKNEQGGPRCFHFPKQERAGFANDLFYNQLCSERRMAVKDRKGNIKWEWHKHASSTRNEVLDMFVYGMGVLEIARVDSEIDGLWRRVRDELRKRGEALPEKLPGPPQPEAAKTEPFEQPHGPAMPIRRPRWRDVPTARGGRGGMFNPLKI